MKSLLLFVAAHLLSLVPVLAQPGRSPQNDNDSAVALRAETDLIREAKNAAKRDDDAVVDAILASVPHGRLRLESSVALMRRTAAVCGWLRNDNEYARATKLARKTIAQANSLRETNSADRIERLYWEAMLEGEILDRKQRAVDLLREALQLAPNNQRIRAEERRWAGALAEFRK